MTTKPRVLFICHSASRNGASIMLLNWLRWLRGVVDWEIEVLVDGHGPLIEDFESVSRTTVWRDPSFVSQVLPRRHRTSARAALRKLSLNALFLGRRFDIIYANTAAVWSHIDALRGKARAIMWHIHELDYVLRVLVPEVKAVELFRETVGVVAVSAAVQNSLMRDYEVPANKIDLVHGFVPAVPSDEETWSIRRKAARKRLGWSEHDFVVGGCGTLGWRKGTDLFLQLVHRLSKTPSVTETRFLWVGGGTDDRDALEFDHDLRMLEAGDRCRRVTTTANVLDYYAAMDVFALTSREDPFPLVMLEAAALARPIVCFAESGGATEFVQDDAGLIAPYLDIETFANHLIRLREAPELRRRLGALAAERVRTSYLLESQAPRLLDAMCKRLTAIGVIAASPRTSDGAQGSPA